jgi:acyl-coenzyme A thioesterase PaaI-like protein
MKSLISTFFRLLLKWSPKTMFELIKSLSGDRVPFIKHVGVDIKDVGPGYAVTQLPDQPHLKNHINTAHAAAIYMLCESASGAATAGTFISVFLNSRPVVREARIKYLRAGKGVLTAKASIDGDVKELLHILEQSGSVDFQVHVDAKAGDGELIAQAFYDWNIKYGVKK